MDLEKLFEKIKYIAGWSVSGFLGGIVYSLGATNFADVDVNTAICIAMGFGAIKALKGVIEYIEDWIKEEETKKYKQTVAGYFP